MSKKLYYTIDKQTNNIDGIEECTGHKHIVTYTIENNRPKEWFQLKIQNEDRTDEAIDSWLEDNGHGDEEIEFIWL